MSDSEKLLRDIHKLLTQPQQQQSLVPYSISLGGTSFMPHRRESSKVIVSNKSHRQKSAVTPWGVVSL